MASTSQKPLPSIPRRTDVPSNPTALTVEGREHLRNIIDSALVEDDSNLAVLSDGGRESWAKAVENALDDLGANIAKGGWLAGVKRSRMARKARIAEESRKLEARKATKESETGKSKGKGKADPAEEAQRREDKELPKHPSDSPASQAEGPNLAFQQIRDIAARPTLPTPKHAKHLLLCLVPLGRDIPVEDSGFDLVSHSTGCSFTPGVFSLPETLSDNIETGILFGLNEWDGMQSLI